MAWTRCAVALSLALAHLALVHARPSLRRRNAAVKSVASLSQEAHFLYTSPATQKSLSVCACAKCGSTSLFLALYKSITGRAKPAGPPWVQVFWKWHAPGVRQSRQAGDVHVHVVRDPIDRLVSGFHSKLKCCPGSARICYPDREWFRNGAVYASELLALSGNATAKRCLHLDDYARSLQAIHRANQQGEINSHFRPQHLGCGGRAHSRAGRKVVAAEGDGANLLAAAANRSAPLLLRGNISQLSAALGELDGFGFKGGRLRVPKSHATPRAASAYELTAYAWRALCEVTSAEYGALRMRAPQPCARTRLII